jgi:hypothetical protein
LKCSLWTVSSSSHQLKVFAAISITFPGRVCKTNIVELESQRKSLTVIIVLLRGRLERRKEIVDRFDFRYIEAMALNDDEKGLSIVSVLSFGRFAWNRKCRVVFSEEIFRKPENSFDDALSLLQKLMADFHSS